MSKPANTVLFCRCPSYQPILIQTAVHRIFELSGGMSRLVRPGQKILIKPNLIAPYPVDKPAQTHPQVILAVAQAVLDAGGRPTVGDSPAWGGVDACLEALGVRDDLIKIGANIVNLDKPVWRKIDGVRVGISRHALEADGIINVPKFKAHQQLGATFAIKNMFGCVSGKQKAIWHFVRGADNDSFCRLIWGIFQHLSPAFNLIDAVVGMQGQGPLSGTAKPLGFLIGSDDAACCELLCTKMIDMPPASLPLLAQALQGRKLDFQSLSVVGDDYRPMVCRDFVGAHLTPLRFSFPRICKSILKQAALRIRHILPAGKS